MQGKRARIAKKTIIALADDENGKVTEGSSTADGGMKDNNNIHEVAVTTNTFYEPTVLPDYRGELYKHVNAKLHQLDIRDADNELIAPQDWYSSLRHGTLVMIRATMHTFNWKEHRVSNLG